MLQTQTIAARPAWAGIVTCAEGGQQQVRRTSDAQTETTTTSANNLSAKGEKLRDEMDALIDEIDEVLEENAEEFVKNYVQRGGE
ncbi:MAG: ubiquitin-like protein Pup [Candidatus Tectomicrobia bacterium]|uniref:Prokaryotic ubiquitin-like protein Pup n=1 Tax=Tectimicrobiota bacterium TaxID=2528274 RepID=A0A937W6T5_UNCTE|nr:ubiquitin-like protein Pup [Candidatus Tectomicrobia bacterium]